MGPPSFAGRLVRAFSARPAANDRRANAAETATTSSANLDLLRAFAVLLVVGFHLVKFFNWRVATMRVTDFGLLGVMFFFVHTTLVLMFSLERQSAGAGTSLFLPFMVRRCFRIYLWRSCSSHLFSCFVFHRICNLEVSICCASRRGIFSRIFSWFKTSRGKRPIPACYGACPSNCRCTWSCPRFLSFFAPEGGVDRDCILVDRRRALVRDRNFRWRAAVERGRHSVSGGGAPEIHALWALFSSGNRGLQVLAAAEISARVPLAALPGSLLLRISLEIGRRTGRNRLVPVFRNRRGNVLLPGVAQERADARHQTHSPVFLRNLQTGRTAATGERPARRNAIRRRAAATGKARGDLSRGI